MTEEAGLRATSVKMDITLSVWVGCSATDLTARRGRGPLLGGRVRQRGQKRKVITEREEKEKQLISRKACGSRDFIKG